MIQPRESHVVNHDVILSVYHKNVEQLVQGQVYKIATTFTLKWNGSNTTYMRFLVRTTIPAGEGPRSKFGIKHLSKWYDGSFLTASDFLWY